MARVTWSATALANVALIVDYVEQFDRIAAERLGRRLLELGDSVAVFPSRGSPGRDGSRQLSVVRPYLLRYRIVGDEVVIIGVRHGARDDEG